MKEDIIEELKHWFTEYVATFRKGDAQYDLNIDIKEAHTSRVCQEMMYIGESIGLHTDDLKLAYIMALLHDVGRFEQYARYGTFADHISVNHAEFGVEVLRKMEVLQGLDEHDRDIICRSISYHNRRDLPENETERRLLFAKMLRDADKLDIWNVFTGYYRENEEKKYSVLIHNFPDTPGLSPDIYSELVATRIANYTAVKNLNDFKLLQVGWVYDVNFTPTFQRIHERGYLDTIRAALPESDQVDDVFMAAREYLTARI